MTDFETGARAAALGDGAQAQHAWDSGHHFYAPELRLDNGDLLKVHPDAWLNARMEAITAVGWKLHTWATAPSWKPRDGPTIPYARPLFVRP